MDMQSPVTTTISQVREQLFAFEQHAAAHGVDLGAQPLLAGFHQCIGNLEARLSTSGERGPVRADFRSELEQVTTRIGESVASVPVAGLVVDRSGLIRDANAHAGKLLNVSPRSLRGRGLHLFVAEERARFLAWLQDLQRGGLIDSLTVKLRPRERRAASIAILAAVDAEGRITLLMCEVAGA